MTTFTKTTICNMTLSHCGIATYISDIETDNSNEAIQCRLWYEPCRDMLLEMTPWSFAEREVAPSNLGDPPDAWGYRYLYPNNFKRINHIVDPYQRVPKTVEDKIPYKIQDYPDNAGKIILCDVEDAIINGNYWVTNEGLFTATYAQMLSLFIATNVVTPLRVDANIAARIDKKWATWLSEAQVQSKAERQDDPLPDSEYVTARG